MRACPLAFHSVGRRRDDGPIDAGGRLEYARVMATVRSGTRDALVVIDVQRGVVADAWDRDRVVGNVGVAVDRARAAGVPVIWVQHSDGDLELGSEAWRIVPELAPRPDEVRVDKHYESSFEETALEDALADLGATRLVIAGAATNWCVRATSYAALDRGYDLLLVQDAHTTDDLEFEDGHVVSASGIVDDLNAVLRWISFPGRSSGTAIAAALWEEPPAG